MKLTELPDKFIEAKPVLETIEQAGYEAYYVGGSVRDVLLNRPIHDVDIATSAYPEEIKAIFPTTIDTGLEHGTVTVMHDHVGYEVTTYRTESGYQDFRRPDKVTFVQNLSEDLKRRDFTINALAMNLDGEIVDHFDGLTDLKNRVIRAVGDADTRFHEDALRMLRAVRFMSQLQFDIDEKTKQGLIDNNYLLEKISVERIREEMVKLALGPDSQAAFKVFLDTGLNDYCPFLKGKKDHLEVFENLQFSPSVESSFWAIMVILLKLDKMEIPKFMRAWKNSNAMKQEVLETVIFFDSLMDHTPSDWELFETGEHILLNAIDVSHILGEPIDFKALVDRYSLLPIKERGQLAVNGQDLIKAGIQPGPHLGEMLDGLLHKVIDKELANDKVTLLDAIKQ
ncbi:MAG: CCA tRNA nucleotidyltransferase [Lactobacillus sp.]|nr:CCA tRNA nucleotidyltransferase [Lactobacillus sp.]